MNCYLLKTSGQFLQLCLHAHLCFHKTTSFSLVRGKEELELRNWILNHYTLL